LVSLRLGRGWGETAEKDAAAVSSAAIMRSTTALAAGVRLLKPVSDRA